MSDGGVEVCTLLVGVRACGGCEKMTKCLGVSE